MLKLEAFSCVQCTSPQLERDNDTLVCPTCQARYPIIENVPLMFTDSIVLNKPQPSQAFVEEMMRACDLPPVDRIRHIVRDIFSRSYQFGSFLINVESAQFVERVIHSTSTTLKESDNEGRRYHISQQQGIPVNDSERIRYRWMIDYLPRIACKGTTLISNVRLDNVGASTLSSNGSEPVYISYHWCDTDGNVVFHDGERTSLLIDLLPGRQLTTPMTVRTPDRAGSYLLEITLVHEGVRWLDAFARRIPMHIQDEAPAPLTASWHISGHQAKDHADDHARALIMLREQIAALGVERPRILEVGGNASPYILGIEGELYNIDVDLHGLQVGHLRSEAGGFTIQQVCCDANALPFADDYFDVIVIFASLHHFPDLPAVLRALARKLRPGGLLAALCEPLGHVSAGAMSHEFHNELLKGVNEQSFEPEEYARTFRQARLMEKQITVDVGSLKAFLTKPMS